MIPEKEVTKSRDYSNFKKHGFYIGILLEKVKVITEQKHKNDNHRRHYLLYILLNIFVIYTLGIDVLF